MKILVTGGAGFVGSHLVDELIKLNHDVFIIDDLSCGKKEFVNKYAKFFKLDIRSKKIEKILKKYNFDRVYHLAAQKSVPYSIKNPECDANINILGSINLFNNCVQYKVGRVIFTSSGGAIYDEANNFPTTETEEAKPISPYAIAKFTIEKYLKFYNKVHNLNYTIIRPANIYGPRQDPMGEAGVIAIFISNLLQKKQCFINGGNQTRDFVFVTDVVNSLVKALNAKNEIYNISTENDISIKDLYEKIKTILESNIEAELKPSVVGEVFKSQLSYQKIKNDLDWSPKYSLEDGIRETINYFNKII